MKRRIRTRLIWRKIKGHRSGFVGVMVLILVGVAFLITLTTIARRYEESAERYFETQHTADVTLLGGFDRAGVAVVNLLPGITRAQGRSVRDIHAEDGTVHRVVSMTEGINDLWYYEGDAPQGPGECAVIQRSARALQLGIGDTLEVEGRALRITAIVDSPEYIYMAQSPRMPMAAPDRFVLVFVHESELTASPAFAGYNEIVMLLDGEPAESSAPKNLAELASKIGAERAILAEEQLNYTLYREDLKQIGTFSYLFPAVFAVLIVVVIYVMLARIVLQERRQIGICKALGLREKHLLTMYAAGYAVAAVPAALAGCLIASLVCNTIISIFGAMFVVPTLHFVVYPELWLSAVAASALICLLSGTLPMRRLLRVLPAKLLRPREPKSGKRILLERLGLWRRLSWGTRYALKSALRNKGRFSAMLLGMCAACALLVFSLGFYDSIIDTQTRYFRDFTRYDVTVDFDVRMDIAPHPAEAHADSSAHALTLPAMMEDLETRLIIADADFDMYALPEGALAEGVILPTSYAKELGLRVGDFVDIRINVGMDMIYRCRVSGIVEQTFGLALFTAWPYLHTIEPGLSLIYNTLYLRSESMDQLTQALRDEGASFTTIEEDRESIASVMDSLIVLVFFMLLCAVVLGVAVLYSVGQINLAARSHEYLFMGVMGYGRNRVLAAHLRETVLQLVIAIPLGYALGNGLLLWIKDSFSGEGFVLAAAIFPQTYILAALVTVGITALMIPALLRFIDRMDIVEGLKVQEE